MATIGVLIDDMFEDVEYTAPVEAFKKAGYKIINIGEIKRKSPKLINF